MDLRVLVLLGLALRSFGHVAPGGLTGMKYRNSLHLMFETVREEVTGEVLPVTSGSMPTWLHGAKINNGFGQFEGEGGGKKFQINHLADVMSYLTKFEFSNGTVRLWDKIQHTKYWNQAKKEIPPYRTFNGTTPSMSPIDIAKVVTGSLVPNDNLNVAAIQLNVNAPTRMFGNSDMKGFNEADADMNYVGWLNFNEINKPDLGFADIISATHIGNTLGDKYIYGYNYLIGAAKGKSLLAAWRIDMTQPDKGPGTELTREWIDSLEVPSYTHLSYMHTIGNSPNYVVFIGAVFQYNIADVLSHIRILRAMEYHKEEKNQIWVLNKSSGKFIHHFTADPFWFYHFVNVYEDGNSVVLDFNEQDYRHIETAFSNDDLRNDAPWRFQAKPTMRLVVDMTAPEGTNFAPTEIGPSYDLGTIHPNLHGHKYRWSWGLAWSGKSLWWDTIIKHDVTNKKVVATWQRNDHYPGELNAIAKPGATSEDDVVLLTVVLGGDYGTSYLLVLDGKDLSPIAEAKARYPLPFGSHGCWQPYGKTAGCIGETTADPNGKPAVFPDVMAVVV